MVEPPQKIEKLQSRLHLVDAPEDVHAGAAAASGAKKGVPPPKHIVFVDSDDEARRFDAVAHFDTVPELLDRPANRLHKQQLEQVQLAPSDADLEVHATATNETRVIIEANLNYAAANYAHLRCRSSSTSASGRTRSSPRGWTAPSSSRTPRMS